MASAGDSDARIPLQMLEKRQIAHTLGDNTPAGATKDTCWHRPTRRLIVS